MWVWMMTQLEIITIVRNTDVAISTRGDQCRSLGRLKLYIIILLTWPSCSDMMLISSTLSWANRGHEVKIIVCSTCTLAII